MRMQKLDLLVAMRLEIVLAATAYRLPKPIPRLPGAGLTPNTSADCYCAG